MLAALIPWVVVPRAASFGQEVVPSGGIHDAAVEGTPRNGDTDQDISADQRNGYGRSSKSPDPQSLLEEALRILEMRRSVSARIRQEIDLFGKRLVGSGNYLEQRQDRDISDTQNTPADPDRLMRLVRLELKIQHGDQASSLVQVAAMPDSNGRRFLWTKRKVLDKEQLSRIDLDRVAQERVAQEKVAQELDPAERKLPQLGRMGMLRAEGGLATILQNLYDCFDFTDAQLGRLGSQGQLVWRIQGKWKPELLARAAGKPPKGIGAATSSDPSRLPPHLPDQVVLHLRHEDLFPYRIEYRRTISKRSAEPKTRAMVTMEFYDVVVDRPIPIQRFVYNPGDLDYADETTEYLESLKGRETGR